jgi:hypothetical protein
MQGKTYYIKISNNSNTKEKQYSDFDEWFDYESQRVEQERLLLKEIKYQESIIKSKLKKITK